MASIIKIINMALEGLNPRQREVITSRFGLEKQGEGETLAAIGERLNVTRERIRQIENGAVTLVKANIAENAEASSVVEKIKKYIAGNGGVAKKSDVVDFASSIANTTDRLFPAVLSKMNSARISSLIANFIFLFLLLIIK